MSRRDGLAMIAASILLAFAATNSVVADECQALGAEVTARVSDVSVDRRTSVALFLAHPSVKYASIGCNPSKNFVAVMMGNHPRDDYFDFLGAAGAIVLRGNSEIVREGAMRCLKRALEKPQDDTSFDFEAFSFVCSADKSSTIVTVQKR